MVLTNIGETIVLAFFYAFVCFYYFLVRDGRFTYFVILGDSIALPWCIGF